MRAPKNGKAAFLRTYALYLAGEKRREEERIELSGTLGKAPTTNKVCSIQCSTSYWSSLVFGSMEALWVMARLACS